MADSGQRKFIIGGAIVLLAIGWLIFFGMGGSTTYYLTVEELMAEGPSERNVRLAGTIAEGSIEWDARNLVLSFEVADESGGLPVVYHGLRPDMFRDGGQAVVEGTYTEEGVFEAYNLLLKCPSKYEE